MKGQPRPRIVGLTASPIIDDKSLDQSKIKAKMQILCDNLNCSIFSNDDIDYGYKIISFETYLVYAYSVTAR